MDRKRASTSTSRQKGGAEKARAKKRQLLVEDAQACRKLTDMLSGRSSSSSGQKDASTEAESNPSASEEERTVRGPVTSCSSQDTAAKPLQTGFHDAPTIAQQVPSEPVAIQTSGDSHGSAPIPDSYTQFSSVQTARSQPEPSPVAGVSSAPSMFQKPKSEERDRFFKFHPVQPSTGIPFTAQKVYFNARNEPRLWVTFDTQRGVVLCSICLCYCSQSNSFTTGVHDWTHLVTRLKEHEKSKAHMDCAAAHLCAVSKATVDVLLLETGRGIRQRQVEQNRQIFRRIIEAIKVIGKRGLSYRGDKNEAAYTLLNEDIDHGNFLELLLFLGKFDNVMRNHIEAMAAKSAKQHDSGKKTAGGLVTFLSKTTANYIIEAYTTLLKEKIAKDVQEAEMYSVQLDTTQDVSVCDQCSVVIRYVKDCRICERVVAIVRCTSTTGEAFVTLLLGILQSMNLDVRKCVGTATDGAANMQGRYSGFATRLSEHAPAQLRIWCFAHVLNLVMSDATCVVVPAVSLFGLLNSSASFVRESYPRMEEWCSRVPKKRLNLIGDTRWWAKEAALAKIFGHYDTPTDSLFVELIETLDVIANSPKTPSEAKFKALGLLQGFAKFETVLTAQLFLRIFEVTTPLSKYLQSKDLNLLAAYGMVQETLNTLEQVSRDFNAINQAAQKFTSFINEKLETSTVQYEMELKLPERRARQKRRQFDYEAQHETPTDATELYRIGVYNVVLDTAIGSIRNRFEAHRDLFADFAVLDPRSFVMLASTPCPLSALQGIAKRLAVFDSILTAESLSAELRDFASKWNTLKECLNAYPFEPSDPVMDMDGDQGQALDPPTDDTSCGLCSACAACCYKVLRKFNLYACAYPGLSLAYKLLLTLSVTQVSCERSFSVLRFIKNRLRSSLNQQHLEGFLIMSSEKDLHIDANEIIDAVASRSAQLRRLLVV
jgi:hypothetical protein